MANKMMMMMMVATRCMQTTVIDYCHKHVDSRWLRFSGHHRAKT